MRIESATVAHSLGYTHLQLNESASDGWLVSDTGSRRHVFLRKGRSRKRFLTELSALELIREATDGAAPVPEVLAAFPSDGRPLLVLSYEDGVDLASFLPTQRDMPPLPPGYVHTPAPEAASFDWVAIAGELGHVFRLLHTVRVAEFGLLLSEDPNPHRNDARAFTRREAQYRLDRSAFQGWLTDDLSETLRSQILDCVQMIDPTETPTLIHYDVHPGNIRLRRHESGVWQVGSVLDWELARGWLPEYDFVKIRWFLEAIGQDVWAAFLDGYGPLATEFFPRLWLFEVAVGLGVMAFSSCDSPWGIWCQSRLNELADRYGRA